MVMRGGGHMCHGGYNETGKSYDIPDLRGIGDVMNPGGIAWLLCRKGVRHGCTRAVSTPHTTAIVRCGGSTTTSADLRGHKACEEHMSKREQRQAQSYAHSNGGQNFDVFQAIVVTEFALRAGNELGAKHLATAEDCGAKRRK